MASRSTLIVILVIFLVPYANIIQVEANSSSSLTEFSVGVSKFVWMSDEEFSADVYANNTSSGQQYSIEWQIIKGNDSSNSNLIVDSGLDYFTSTGVPYLLKVQSYHLNSSYSYLHRLVANLSLGGAVISHDQVNFSAFTNTLPTNFSDIKIFGDSLSDMGNSYNQWGTPDSPPYWNGRFTNGEVWSEQFGQFMGHTMTPGRGTASGNNRAYGGAHSGSGTYLFVIPNVGRQVDDYVQNYVIAQSDLVIIWCGGNDFVHSDEQNPQTIVDNIESHINKLSNVGATNFFIVDLPPLETAPRVSEEKDDAGVADLRNRIVDFNIRLSSMLNNTENQTTLTIYRASTWNVFDIVYNNPSYFGITNLTHPACDHDGYTCDNNDPIAPNADEYVFFDKMHPTRIIHDLFDMYAREILGVSDIDGDNIPDDDDACPYTLPEVEILPNGCDKPPPDIDGDGVLNEQDYCPNTPQNESVNSDGCSESQIDSDQDGIMNNVDDCPNTPVGETVDEKGCSWSQFDDDSDGVTNGADNCPNTNESSTVDLDGCAEYQKDDDNDLVYNDLDLCPGTWAGSQVDTNGCALYQKDTDDDGVKDSKDNCPQTPIGDNVDQQGCGATQKDDDSDGVMNAYDECDNTQRGESVNAVGCALSQLDTDYDGFSDDVDRCENTTYGELTDDNGCSNSQIDSDEDGFFNHEDMCINTPGEVTGCPTFSIDVLSPKFASQHFFGNNVTFEVATSCSSGCIMQLEIISREGDFNSPIFENISNGSVSWNLILPNQTTYQKIDFDITVLSGDINETISHTILISELEVLEQNPVSENDEDTQADTASSKGNIINSNGVTIGLLFCILIAVVALYRQRKTPPQKVSNEEMWMEQTDLVSRENSLEIGEINDGNQYL